MLLAANAQAGVLALGFVTVGTGVSAEAAPETTRGHRAHRRAALIQSVKRRMARSLLWWALLVPFG